MLRRASRITYHVLRITYHASPYPVGWRADVLHHTIPQPVVPGSVHVAANCAAFAPPRVVAAAQRSERLCCVCTLCEHGPLGVAIGGFDVRGGCGWGAGWGEGESRVQSMECPSQTTHCFTVARARPAALQNGPTARPRHGMFLPARKSPAEEAWQRRQESSTGGGPWRHSTPTTFAGGGGWPPPDGEGPAAF
jgi:hypothetical protein